MRLRVLLHNDQTAALAQRLAKAQPDVGVTECQSYDALPDQLTRFHPDVVYTVRFAGTPGFPRDALFGTDGPRWISNGGVGVDHFGKWNAERTTVTNAAGVAAGMMAEFVIGGFLHFTLDVPGLLADKDARVWRPRTVTPLDGKTLLIVGLGHTGQALAARAKAFGMRVIGTRASPQPMENVDLVASADELPNLIAQADAIAVAAPLTPKTHRLIGVPEIAQMKPGVLFADVSRGGVVDQSALGVALSNGQVKAAVLDVFETEPLSADDPLWGLANVLISPHCSSVYDGWEEASFDMFLDNLERFIAGDPLENVVDPKRGY